MEDEVFFFHAVSSAKKNLSVNINLYQYGLGNRHRSPSILSDMTTQQVHLRIPKNELKVIDDVADGLVSRQQAATIIFRKALAVIKENPERFKLFPAFDSAAALSEAKPTED